MLITNWKMSYLDKKDLPCSAPCSMYGILLENGLIPDPYYGTNEHALTALAEHGCIFEASFALEKEDFEKEYNTLIFHGLDTICAIYLNGIKLGEVMNMHRSYEFSVGEHLRCGENTLRLEFSSAVNYYRAMDKNHPLYTNDDSIQGAAHLRKALFMSGWDWAPALPDMGIFRPVELISYNCDRLEEVFIRQHHENGRVSLSLSASTKHRSEECEVFAEVNGERVPLEGAINSFIGKAEIENPRLWWPRGYGEQALYPVTFKLVKDGVVIDEITKNIGLRTLTVSTEKQSDGREFCFVVNGVKIFAMGANYVPMDSIISRVTPEKIDRLLDDCCFANFNCVRVWGGAYYPEDHFYNACDKRGLIVWQDFMFACIDVWMRPDFEREVTLEAIENVKRLRHHPSLALLCGNNEMEWAVTSWHKSDSMLVKLDYLKLYEQLLPEICGKHAPDTYYLSSSPTSGGGFDNPQDPSRGDVHFWDVWLNGKPFDEYRKHKFRFCSEYGFESLPSAKTVRYFCPPEEENLLSYTMESHQKHKNGNPKLLSYLASVYKLPKTLDGLVYATQLNQANAIKFGVEHFRRHRGYTMGSVYWQLNDCWPVSSWSSVDYFGRYKALHYFARKFYAPVAMGLFADGKSITVNVANETLCDFCGKIKVGVMTADLKTVYTDECAVCLPSLTSRDVSVSDFSAVHASRDKFFFAELYDDAGELIMRQCELGTKPKHFIFKKPTFTVSAENVRGGVRLNIASDVFAKNVEISFANFDPAMSDNYFDLTAKDPVSITVYTDKTADELLSDMTVRSVYDIEFL